MPVPTKRLLLNLSTQLSIQYNIAVDVLFECPKIEQIIQTKQLYIKSSSVYKNYQRIAFSNIEDLQLNRQRKHFYVNGNCFRCIPLFIELECYSLLFIGPFSFNEKETAKKIERKIRTLLKKSVKEKMEMQQPIKVVFHQILSSEDFLSRKLNDWHTEIPYNLSHFSREFSAHLGMPYNHYQNELRLNESLKLLLLTHLSISEIAQKIGYHDASHFSKHFKEKTGETPSSYRKKNIKNSQSHEFTKENPKNA